MDKHEKKPVISKDEAETLEKVASIPYIVYEISERRHQMRERWFLCLIAALIALLVVCNMAWLYVFQSYDYSSYAQEGDGYNNIITGTAGDVNNGTTTADPT